MIDEDKNCTNCYYQCGGKILRCGYPLRLKENKEKESFFDDCRRIDECPVHVRVVWEEVGLTDEDIEEIERGIEYKCKHCEHGEQNTYCNYHHTRITDEMRDCCRIGLED